MEEVLAALGVLVLSRGRDGAFAIRGSKPAWYLRLFPDAKEDPIRVVDRFPFLESFLPTAEKFWGAKGAGMIRSGFWVETYPSGREVPLQAAATVIGGEELLLVEYVRGEFEHVKGLLQKAREHRLEDEQSDALRHAMQTAQARTRALARALPATVLRLRRDGTVLEGGPGASGNVREILPADVADLVLQRGTKAMDTGRPERFSTPEGTRGSLAPISTDEFWAVVERPR